MNVYVWLHLIILLVLGLILGLPMVMVVLVAAWRILYSIVGLALARPNRETAKNGIDILLFCGAVLICLPFIPVPLWPLEALPWLWGGGGACLASAGLIALAWRTRGGLGEQPCQPQSLRDSTTTVDPQPLPSPALDSHLSSNIGSVEEDSSTRCEVVSSTGEDAEGVVASLAAEQAARKQRIADRGTPKVAAQTATRGRRVETGTSRKREPRMSANNPRQLAQVPRHLREGDSRRPTRRRRSVNDPVIITVFSPHVTGKTTIATNLAVALVEVTNGAVVLADLDPRLGDVAILMDIPVERSIVDLAMPEEEITREIVEECTYTHNTGVTILPAPIRPTDWGNNVHAGHIERAVALLMESHDYVILDTPLTFNDIVARALEMATIVLLVWTVDVASPKDTLLAIDMLRSWNFPKDKIRLVVNSINEATTKEPDEIKWMLGRDVFWSVPYDRSISAATQLGMPVVAANPQSKAAQSLIEMARSLTTEV